MRKNHNLFYFGLILIFILSLLAYMKTEICKHNLRSGAIDFDPFTIDGTGTFGYTWSEAINESICTGSGAWNDPYIIDSVRILGNGSACLTIVNSSAYFIIRNSIFSESGLFQAGITLANVSNGKITNNSITDNYHGISLFSDCNNITIEQNIVSGSSENGIWINNSVSNFVKDNQVIRNGWNGIVVTFSDNLTITSNVINLNALRGVYLKYSNNNIISNNSFLDNGECIVQENCFGNIVSNNNCLNSWEMFWTEFWENTLKIAARTLPGAGVVVSISIGGIAVQNAVSKPMRIQRKLRKLNSRTEPLINGSYSIPNPILKMIKIPIDLLNQIGPEKILKTMENFDLYYLFAKEFLFGCSLCRKQCPNGMEKLKDVKCLCAKLTKYENFSKLYDVCEDYINMFPDLAKYVSAREGPFTKGCLFKGLKQLQNKYTKRIRIAVSIGISFIVILMTASILDPLISFIVGVAIGTILTYFLLVIRILIRMEQNIKLKKYLINIQDRLNISLTEFFEKTNFLKNVNKSKRHKYKLLLQKYIKVRKMPQRNDHERKLKEKELEKIKKKARKYNYYDILRESKKFKISVNPDNQHQGESIMTQI